MVGLEMMSALQAAGFDGTRGRAAAGLTVTQQSALQTHTQIHTYVCACGHDDISFDYLFLLYL